MMRTQVTYFEEGTEIIVLVAIQTSVHIVQLQVTRVVSILIRFY